MLSLRFAIFAGLCGVALWGLFSLLDNLREPQLLRSPKAVIVKGCDSVETREAMRVCPQLFCQKALLDARLLGRGSRFEVTVDARNGDEHLIGGIARTRPPAGELRFACLIESGKVVAFRVMEAAQLEILSAQAGDWTL